MRGGGFDLETVEYARELVGGNALASFLASNTEQRHSHEEKQGTGCKVVDALFFGVDDNRSGSKQENVDERSKGSSSGNKSSCFMPVFKRVLKALADESGAKH